MTNDWWITIGVFGTVFTLILLMILIFSHYQKEFLFDLLTCDQIKMYIKEYDFGYQMFFDRCES